MRNAITSVRWDRAGERMGGQRDRAQRFVYAVQVNENMPKGKRLTEDGMLMCPLTGQPFNILNGEVDKLIPEDGYTIGNVILVSKQGNQGRGKRQQHYGDIPGAARYIRDATIAASRVSVLAPTQAFTVAKAMGWGDYDRAVMAGPYGIA